MVEPTGEPRARALLELLGEEGRLREQLARDLAVERRDHQRLEEQTQLLRQVIEHLPAAVALFDRELRYLAYSRRWLADYRLGEQDLLGRSHYEVFPEIPESWKRIHQRCLAGAVEQRAEDPFLREDGSLDWTRWELRPVWLNGKVEGLILYTEVITEQKQLEDEHARLLAEERAARFDAEEENAAKDRFLALVAHELRNPIAPITTGVEILRRSCGDAQRAERSMELIERNARLIARLVDDLLDLSRMRQGKLELRRAPLDLPALVRATVDGFAAEAARARLTLRAEVEPGPLQVAGDADRLEQVLGNLIRNALKFTPAGGLVHVTLEREGSAACLRVHDSGIGIAPELLPRKANSFRVRFSRRMMNFSCRVNSLLGTHRSIAMHHLHERPSVAAGGEEITDPLHCRSRSHK